MMTSQAWQHSSKIEDDYDSVRAALVARVGVEDALRRGFENPHTRGLALEMMFDLPVKYTIAFAAEVFDDATSTSGHYDLARDVLARIDFYEATTLLRPLLDERLATDDNAWEAYLRSAEVLGELGQQELLNYVVDQARLSGDPDVVMTAEMFDHGSFSAIDRVALREDRHGKPFKA